MKWIFIDIIGFFIQYLEFCEFTYPDKGNHTPSRKPFDENDIASTLNDLGTSGSTKRFSVSLAPSVGAWHELPGSSTACPIEAYLNLIGTAISVERVINDFEQNQRALIAFRLSFFNFHWRGIRVINKVFGSHGTFQTPKLNPKGSLGSNQPNRPIGFYNRTLLYCMLPN